MIVVDDIIPKSLQDNIEAILLGNNFPWYLQKDITFTYGGDKALGFSHFYKHVDKAPNSSLFDLVSIIAHLGAEKYGFSFKEIIQARSFMQVPLSKNVLDYDVEPLHVDHSFPHLVVLYYVSDADGDTILSDKMFDPLEGARKDCRIDDYKIVKRITPKKGRAVIFDGACYHTVEQTQHSTRCVINFNLA
jgi:hypothetical protein